ncbi:MAG: hypothetical protein L0Z62_37795 [Gemmataceae bacterium]|nr:hypothetical protein [Gemmataceae bacterium]
MDGSAPQPAPSSRRLLAVWPLLFLGLVACQGWMTLSLFGPEQPWTNLLSEEPILSGRHPLHLYHGHLGARAFYTSGRTSCYDPSNLAGYPKTPIFDSGSRPAELFQALAGGAYCPTAYKLGLATACLLVPWLLLLACRGVGMSPAATVLAVGAGLLVWWSAPGRKALEAGDIELLLAALAALAHVGLLVRFDRAPGLSVWLGLLLTGVMSWFAHPLLFPMLLPLLLIYYLSVGARHASLSWHLALLASEAGAVLVNLFWLSEWVSYWWLRSPFPRASGMLEHRTFATIWEASLWGQSADRDLAVLLLGSALIGVCVFNQCKGRVAARLLGMGAGGLLTLAILGIAWQPLGQFGTAGLLVPALWFAALPAAHAWVQSCRLLAYLVRGRLRATLLVGALLAAAGLTRGETLTTFARCFEGAAPLAVGLGPDRQALVDTLVAHTTPEARILWEDRPATRETSRWTALLPVLAGRSFVGGLDPDAGIDHVRTGLVNQLLADRDIQLATDAYLKDYCERYNVGWVVCWSPPALARLRAWKGAEELARVVDGGEGYLFRIRDHVPSIALPRKGQAKLLHADSHHITLGDVVPQNGLVVLSLHYQAGLRASPARVQVEPEPAGQHPVPFVRLRVDSPVTRVTLTWEEK